MAKATRGNGGLAAVLVVALLASGPAPAQDKTRIPKSESKLILDMPGLKGGVEVFQYFGWDAGYRMETYYAAQVGKTALYPRAQVYYRRLAPTIVFRNEEPIDETVIRNTAPYLKDKPIIITKPDSGGGSRERRHARFEVDGADCVHFFVIGGAWGASGASPGSGNFFVSGIYCGAAGARLTEADIAAVFAGWRVLP